MPYTKSGYNVLDSAEVMSNIEAGACFLGYNDCPTTHCTKNYCPSRYTGCAFLYSQ